MTAPTPEFQMVADVLALPDGQDCRLHVTVKRATPIDAYEYRNDTRYKQFLLVEDGAGASVGVRWFGPKYDLRAGDIVQMYPGANEDRAKCTIGTDTSGKRTVKVSAFAMVLCTGPERPAVLPEANGSHGPQQAAGGGAPPNYSQPANGGQQRPVAGNGGLAPVTRQRYDHEQIMALQRAVYSDRLLLVGENTKPDDMTHRDICDIATRLTATVVIAVVDGKVDLAAPSGNGQGSGGGPPADYQAPGPKEKVSYPGPREGDDEDIPF